MSRDFYVYVYLDPRKPGKYGSGQDELNNEPVYVGMGFRENRWKEHLEEVKKLIKENIDNKWIRKNHYNPHKIFKIKKILNLGLEPIIIKVLENATKREAKAEEIRLISLYGRADKGLGPLTNLTDGGEGGSTTKGRKPYTDGKIVKYFYEGEQPEGWLFEGSNKGKNTYNNGSINRMFFEGEQPEGWIKGSLWSPTEEHIEKFKAANIGRIVSKETTEKQKQSLYHFYYETEEGINRRVEISKEMAIRMEGKNNSFYGNNHSEESKAIMSEKNTGENNSIFGKIVYNNGINQKYFGIDEQPDPGYVIGALKSTGNNISKALKDKIAYNNGKIERKFYKDEQPEGWVLGILEKNKEKRKGENNGMYGKKGKGNPNFGKRSYTNGLKNIRCIPGTEPKDWVRGNYKYINN